MKRLLFTVYIMVVLVCGCSHGDDNMSSRIKLISWGGIPADKADTMYTLAKECGFDIHLGLYRSKESALMSMDAAARAGIGVIINFPQIKDSTESAVALVRNHPALVAYHIKDEPDTSDFGWLKQLNDRIHASDPEHPCYINLFPNWAWGEEEYSEKIESFASQIDIPFFSFDNYPIIEENGEVKVRPDWYRNLEEFSQMSIRHGKPFWGFVLAKSHSIAEPFPPTFYPEPTLGHIRLQAFSNLLYGAQAIQYFNFTGIVDSKTCEKLPSFDIIRLVNSEIKAYSSVFSGCKVLGIWHTGDMIPSHTKRLVDMPHEKLKSLDITGNGAVVSLIENSGKTYLAVQNRDHLNDAVLKIVFSSRVNYITPTGPEPFNGHPITLGPGEVAIFRF